MCSVLSVGLIAFKLIDTFIYSSVNWKKMHFSIYLFGAAKILTSSTSGITARACVAYLLQWGVFTLAPTGFPCAKNSIQSNASFHCTLSSAILDIPTCQHRDFFVRDRILDT